MADTSEHVAATGVEETAPAPAPAEAVAEQPDVATEPPATEATSDEAAPPATEEAAPAAVAQAEEEQAPAAAEGEAQAQAAPAGEKAEEEIAGQKRPLESDDHAEDHGAAKAAKLDEPQPAAAAAAAPAADHHQAAHHGGSPAPSGTDNGVPDYLPQRVKDALERLYASGQVGRHDLDQQALDSLRDFSEDVGVEIIDKYREADLSGIRNKTGFFIGIIKRYRNSRGSQYGSGGGGGGGGYGQHHSPYAPHGGAPSGTSASMLSAPRAELFPSTQQKLDALYASGKVNPAELGDVLEQLKTFTEETANTIVDKFQEADLGNIRSKSGFLMGIVRRFQDQVQSGSSQANVQAFQQLPYSVQLRLTPYYQNGIIGQNDIEARVFQSLAQFNEHVCNEIINKFLESDLTRVSNKSGWLIGIIKRFRNNGAVAHPSNAALHQANNQQYLAQMAGYGGAYAAAYAGGAPGGPGAGYPPQGGSGYGY